VTHPGRPPPSREPEPSPSGPGVPGLALAPGEQDVSSVMQSSPLAPFARTGPEIDRSVSFPSHRLLEPPTHTSTRPQGGGRPVAARRGDGFA
jgi:hypothetical protein